MMSFSWLPPDIARLKPYEPGKPIEEVQRELGLKRVIKLASNENAFGPAPSVLEAIQKAADRAPWYPDGGAYYLRHELSRFLNVPPEHLAFGGGSTELVQLLVLACLTPDDHAILADATFLMYRLALQTNRIPFTAVPLQDGTYDLQRFLDAVQPNTRIIFIANPNNPTGDLIPDSTFREFLAALPDHVLVVYDAAYYHFVTQADYSDGIPYYRDDPRVIVLHTFSKAYALANLRIGYAVAHPEIIRGLNIVRSPFNTSDIAQIAARAALADQSYMQATVQRIIQERQRVYRILKEQGWHVYPSETNFLCVRVKQDPYELFRTLLSKGIIVRPLPPFGVPDGIRITIGTPEDNDYLLETLEDLSPS